MSDREKRDLLNRWRNGDTLTDKELYSLQQNLEDAIEALFWLGDSVHSTWYYLRMQVNSVSDTLQARERERSHGRKAVDNNSK